MARWKKGRLSGPHKEPLPDLVFDKTELVIGSRFVVDEEMFEVIEAADCDSCGFRQRICPRLSCEAVERADGRDVSFCKIKKK